MKSRGQGQEVPYIIEDARSGAEDARCYIEDAQDALSFNRASSGKYPSQ